MDFFNSTNERLFLSYYVSKESREEENRLIEGLAQSLYCVCCQLPVCHVICDSFVAILRQPF